MKICTFIHPGSVYSSQKRLGILLEEEQIMIDANLVWTLDYLREGHHNPIQRAYDKVPPSLHQVLSTKDNPFDLLEESYGLYLFLEKVGDLEFPDGSSVAFPVNTVNLTCPLDKIETYRDFYAHEKHVKKGFEKRKEKIPEAWYEIPAYYKGATKHFIGPHDKILWPHYSDVLDYELELAAVIGRDGYNVKEEKALDHIFGFTILNDISARDIQKKEMSIRLGPAKGKDFCSILGPVITTIDEFDFKEPNLLMTATINDEKWSEGRSGDAHYSFSQMISHTSQDEWIVAGDVFGSGTVGTGCGLELDRWIQPGDIVDLYVEKIGHLTNQVGEKQKPGFYDGK